MKMKYYSIFQYDPEDDAFNISFPDLPGCLSCAWSEEEALAMAKEALELHIEDEPFEDLPKPTPPEDIKLEENEKVYLISAEYEPPSSS